MKLILFSFFFISLKFIISTYSPQTLLNYYLTDIKNNIKTNTFPYIFLDPLEYISEKEELIEIQNVINEKNNVYVLTGVIDKMDTSSVKSLQSFAEKFVQLFYDNDSKYVDNSITIILSISQREIWITTGNKARKKYTNSIIDKILEIVLPDLKKNNYRESLYELLNNILEVDKIENMLTKEYICLAVIIIFIFLVIFLVILICCLYWKGKLCSCCYKKQTITEMQQIYIDNLEKFLNNINIEKAKQKEIYTDACIICLEKFVINNISDNQNDIASNNEIPVKEKKQIKNDQGSESNSNIETNNIKVENNNTLKITLECGHQFHKKCIKDWLSNQKQCPICRENFDIAENGVELREKVINVHRSIEPMISDWVFLFNGAQISHRIPIILPINCCSNCGGEICKICGKCSGICEICCECFCFCLRFGGGGIKF